ncbi:MAG: hypothetical protein ACYC11_13385 [Bellilinea sp.]
MNSLRERLAGMQEQIKVKEGEPPSPEVVNLLGRLNTIMEQADQFFDAGESLTPAEDIILKRKNKNRLH